MKGPELVGGKQKSRSVLKSNNITYTFAYLSLSYSPDQHGIFKYTCRRSILALNTETQSLTIPSFTPTKHCPPFHTPTTPYPCHLLLILIFCILWIPIHWKLLSRVWLFVTLWAIQSMEFSRPEYWSGSFSLLQGIFPTQGSNPGLWHRRKILYQLSHKGSPIILEWVACPFSSRSSWSRNRTGVSCIAGRFFTNWAIMEALYLQLNMCL